ncbi:hypothetical protein [Prevotella communis]|uniref:hypothetical protein n=1 Tax=Prevotella communis TaxID=2913614 RepID=UPI001EDACE40|nr:hypothetical protein [Prevotella communis]UKK56500.1 hypothetical protein L6476_13780 [Prevotella communis]UKK62027.1 hypothetical protein L6468_13775 [Prevotella communis]UKK64854.1 hypothetical protein L6473_13785 [Prevotella communis]
MKKLQLLAYAGAIALLSTGITACSDDNLTQEVTPSPGYNPETNEVNADFVFNVSTGTGSTTRMSSENVQAAITTSSTELFRGIDNAKLFTYKIRNTDNSGVKDGWHIAYAPTPTPVVKMFDLGAVMGRGSIAPASTDKTKSRRVVELNLPVETNTLLFYGKAIKDGTDVTQGAVDMEISANGNMNANFFRLKKIIADGSDKQTEFLQSETLISAVLNKIIRSSYTLPADLTMDGRTIPSGRTVRWQDYVTITRDGTDGTKITSIVAKTTEPVYPSGESAPAMKALGEILANTYVTFNTIYVRNSESELRAGSGPAIKRMMNDLYTTIAAVRDASATNVEETMAKRLAGVVCNNIATCFDTSAGCEWKANSNLKTFTELTAAQVDKIGDDEKFTDFPKTEFNLPYGATILQISYNPTLDINAPEYSYMGAVPTYAMGGSSGSTSAFDPSNWVYAPELMYFGNSPIRVTDATKSTADYPDGTTNWVDNDNSQWSDWADNSHVKSTTRSVAMRNCINYANALLRMNVKYGTNVLKDNNHQIQYERNNGANEPDNVINVANAGMFQLTGIAIGGVNRSVGWNFLPRYDATVDGTSGEQKPKFGCMVYDSAIPDGTIPMATGTAGGGASAYNYTLLWDNWDDDLKGSAQRVVYVALEFKNMSGKDFWGMNNLIRKEGTFYITAKLDPDAVSVEGKTAQQVIDDKSLGITWPDTYEMPPYYTTDQANAAHDPTLDSKTIKERRVFMQDYMTDVTFVLTENSLKYALVAVPDLRSTQISLGLSVDLHWREGLKFGDVNVGGGQ